MQWHRDGTTATTRESTKRWTHHGDDRGIGMTTEITRLGTNRTPTRELGIDHRPYRPGAVLSLRARTREKEFIAANGFLLGGRAAMTIEWVVAS